MSVLKREPKRNKSKIRSRRILQETATLSESLYDVFIRGSKTFANPQANDILEELGNKGEELITIYIHLGEFLKKIYRDKSGLRDKYQVVSNILDNLPNYAVSPDGSVRIEQAPVE